MGLITADYQLEIRSLLTGAGTVYLFDEEGIGGLGGIEVKSHDADLAHAGGAYFGRDYGGVRILTFPYLIKQPTAALAGSSFETLRAAFAPSEATNIDLFLQLPGLGPMRFTGRPRGIPCDIQSLKFGLVRAIGTFVCPTDAIVRPPGAPTIGTATAGAGSATANWTAPVDNGGSAVTGYEVKTYRASDNALLFTNLPGNVLTYTRTGLTAGVAVYFKVAALTSAFNGPQSAASNTVTPT